jgi:hypothetical protein
LKSLSDLDLDRKDNTEGSRAHNFIARIDPLET